MSKILNNRKFYTGTRLSRKNPESMDELIYQFVRQLRNNNEINRQIIFNAWNEASGAGAQTLSKSLVNGVLYVTISSSVLRSQLFMRRSDILVKINQILNDDRFFVSDLVRQNNKSFSADNAEITVNYIKSIILK